MTDYYFKKHSLVFKTPSGTSRGVLHEKTSWFLIAESDDFKMPAIGECSLIEGLSPDPVDSFEATLNAVCQWLKSDNAHSKPDLSHFPSIEFGLEMLLADIELKGGKVFQRNAFTNGEQGMLINGLIWMGDSDFVTRQVKEKVEQGFSCIKMKVGAIDFDSELDMIRGIRREFGKSVELRLDANGGFDTHTALEQLNRLSDFEIHSIEQPIKPYQWDAMSWLCQNSPIPIALDEELIGASGIGQKHAIIEAIEPQYIILKPSLLGGLASCDEWIELAESEDIGWWITSALESNIGLNAVAQYTSTKNVSLPQGLGTGSLYVNNVESPLYIRGEHLHFDPNLSWNLNNLL